MVKMSVNKQKNNQLNRYYCLIYLRFRHRLLSAEAVKFSLHMHIFLSVQMALAIEHGHDPPTWLFRDNTFKFKLNNTCS